MHLKVATSSPEMHRQVSQTPYGQPSSPFLPLFPHCGWLAWPGMAWHQAAACSAKGGHDEQNEAGANETLSMRTASHCLCVWLGKNPGGAVDRKGHLHCPHHQGNSGQKGSSPLSTTPEVQWTERAISTVHTTRCFVSASFGRLLSLSLPAWQGTVQPLPLCTSQEVSQKAHTASDPPALGFCNLWS